MNRSVFYLTAIALHLAVLFWLSPSGDKISPESKKDYVEVTLSLEPAPEKLKPDIELPGLPNAEQAPGPPVDNIPPPVASITPDVKPPPPSPTPISPDATPSSAPAAVPSTTGDVTLLPIGQLSKKTNTQPATGTGKSPSSAPFSGTGHGGGGLGPGGGNAKNARSPHYYQAVYTPKGINWPDAESYAEAHGGYLATIESEEENLFVFSLIRNKKFWRDGFSLNHHSCYLGPWLGGRKRPNDGQWEWLNNDGQFRYKHWDVDEPDNMGLANQDRLHFFSWSGGMQPNWDDQEQSTLLSGFVVEYNTDPATLPPSTEPDSKDIIPGPTKPMPAN